MTKAKIIGKLEDILYDIRNLEDDVFWLNKEIEEKHPEDNLIYDKDNFIRLLKSANLYNKEMEEFLDNYIKFYNFPS